ncbi:MAG: T9SS type A sorting domain-containing protein [Candidatus Eisenbacteria bacterium]|nr:T9SS type A sorting domain-containing protein [Candidatus Latescibacterota bacterium]MBD3300955.1 T9SS type A sorting domain-containing protein [Candidatus Eisenbacteria bacterium]
MGPKYPVEFRLYHSDSACPAVCWQLVRQPRGTGGDTVPRGTHNFISGKGMQGGLFMFLKSTGAAALLAVLVAGVALGVAPADIHDYEVRLPLAHISPTVSNPDEAEAATLLPALADFRSREGTGWKLLQWNDVRETPAAIAGPAIPVVSADATEEAIRASVEAFVARNADLVRADMRDLRITSVTPLRDGRQYVILSQYYEGLEVLSGRVDVALQNGKVVLVGSEYVQGLDVNRYPALDEAAAVRIAHDGIPAHSNDGPEQSPRLVVLPIQTESGMEHHLAWEVYLRTHEPENVWRTYVDAHDGTLLWRESTYHFYEITGTVRGSVEETFEDFRNYPLEDARVTASGSYNGYSNEVGEFSITVPNNVDYNNVSQLSGRYCNVNNMNGTDAEIEITGGPGDDVDFFYDGSNALASERAGYYHTNVVHDWIKDLDPSFTDLDYTMTCAVERTNGSCNAYWNGYSINFYAAGGGCNSIGRLADVIYHEYGHGITQHVYYPYAPPTSSGMGEGFSDIDAICIHPDPLVGEHFFTNGDPVRDARNLRQYPGGECGGQVHCLGEILMGSMYKTRVNMEMKYGDGTSDVFDPLYLDARKTRQFSQPNFLTRLLMANDTDGDLTNGTPDWYEICDAFALHNLPCPDLENYVTVSSVAIDDQPQDTDGYSIIAIVEEYGAGEIDPDAVEIYYTTDPLDGNATWEVVAMEPTGGQDEWAGEIPNLGCGNHVKYYVRAEKYTGEYATAPHLAPYRDVYEFMTGPFDVALEDDAETDQGWSLGWTGDDATEGFWERVDPTGKESSVYGVVQPEDDHTATGSQCFVTDGRGGGWFSYDVDQGVTSLVSPQFDWTTNQGVASVRFWSFFFDDTPNDDFLRVHVSNDDGVSWMEIHTIGGRELNEWTFNKTYFSDSEITFTDQMRVRFTMEDIQEATICAEAAIDDIEIRVNDCNAAGVDDGILPAVFRVEQNRPNPFNPVTAIRFALPKASDVDVAVYDAAGRKVRTLLSEPRTAGYHNVVWDGKDDAGRSVGSGVYYYTVKAGENEASQKMMLLK